ncbi:MAG: hypothetical protein WCO54_08020 [Bacteroidota bacterium]
MKAATLHEIKNELQKLAPSRVAEVCMRLGKYKKDNKELLTYLLFEADDENTFISGVKEEVEKGFSEINSSTLYFAKKSIRKILRSVNRYIRYSGLKQTEVELLIHFCKTLKSSGIQYEESTAMVNLYQSQIKKIRKALSSLHEDIQYDFNRDLEILL